MEVSPLHAAIYTPVLSPDHRCDVETCFDQSLSNAKCNLFLLQLCWNEPPTLDTCWDREGRRSLLFVIYLFLLPLERDYIQQNNMNTFFKADKLLTQANVSVVISVSNQPRRTEEQKTEKKGERKRERDTRTNTQNRSVRTLLSSRYLT